MQPRSSCIIGFVVFARFCFLNRGLFFLSVVLIVSQGVMFCFVLFCFVVSRKKRLFFFFACGFDFFCKKFCLGFLQGFFL